MNDNIKKGLMFTKYIYSQGVEHLAKRSSISTAMAILCFHDASELFLMRVADNLGFKYPDQYLNYWTEASKKGTSLPHRNEMENLNRLRALFKHRGLVPTYDNCKSIQYSLSDFFHVVSRDVLNENYADISLSDIIEYEDVRTLSKNAERCLEQAKYKESIIESAKAFALFEKQAQGDAWYSHMIKENSLSGPTSSAIFDSTKEDRERKTILESMQNRLSVVTHNLNVLLLGIDAYKYRKFTQLAPVVNIALGGRIYAHMRDNAFRNIYNFNYENASFCINFVVDAVLKYQENAFELFNRNIPHAIRIRESLTKVYSYSEGKFIEIGIVEKDEIFENTRLALVVGVGKDFWRILFKGKEGYVEASGVELIK